MGRHDIGTVAQRRAQYLEGQVASLEETVTALEAKLDEALAAQGRHRQTADEKQVADAALADRVAAVTAKLHDRLVIDTDPAGAQPAAEVPA